MQRIAMTLAFILTFVGQPPLTALAQSIEVPVSREQITLSFSPVAKKVIPAVVNIYTRHVEKVPNISPFMGDPFFEQFFGGGGGKKRERVVGSLGSGVIIGAEGTIVTSYHVVKGSDEITIILSDKQEFEGKVVKADERADLAILKVDTKGLQLPTLDLRDSAELEVGDMVLAVGNPFGVGQTVTSGIISALARSAEGVSDYQYFIQTDAAINPGNSGGALVDMQGRLIGINTAIYSRSGGYQGIGFAIPIEMVKVLLNGKVNESGHAIRPWLGVIAQPVTREIAEAQGLKSVRGVLVQQVAKNSPAQKAGIAPGDVLLALGEGAVNDPQSLNFRIATTGMGKAVPATIWRGGAESTLTITLDAPPNDSEQNLIKLTGKHALSDVTVATITSELAEELKLDSKLQGVLVARVGKATRVPVQPGDIILGVNNRPTRTVEELKTALERRVRGFQINLIRGGMSLTMSVM